MKRKILNIINEKETGTAGRALLTYFRHMDRDTYEAAAAVTAGSPLADRVRELDVKVFEVDALSDKSYERASVKTLKKIIDRYDPDLVHTHISLSGRIAARRCGRAVVYTKYSVFPLPKGMNRGPGKIVHKIVNEHYADRIIAVSPAVALSLTRAGISAEKIDIVPYLLTGDFTAEMYAKKIESVYRKAMIVHGEIA